MYICIYVYICTGTARKACKHSSVSFSETRISQESVWNQSGPSPQEVWYTGGISFSQGGQVKLCLSPLGTCLGAGSVVWYLVVGKPGRKPEIPEK